MSEAPLYAKPAPRGPTTYRSEHHRLNDPNFIWLPYGPAPPWLLKPRIYTAGDSHLPSARGRPRGIPRWVDTDWRGRHSGLAGSLRFRWWSHFRQCFAHSSHILTTFCTFCQNLEHLQTQNWVPGGELIPRYQTGSRVCTPPTLPTGVNRQFLRSNFSGNWSLSHRIPARKALIPTRNGNHNRRFGPTLREGDELIPRWV